MTVETVEVNGKRALIEYDTDPMNPREGYNLGRMVCAHRRYNLGDTAKALGWTFRADDFRGWFDVESHLEIHEDALVVVPLYLYDHTNLTLSTGRFSCPWDSGQVGFAYVTNEAAKAAWPSLEGAALVDAARKCLEAEVEVYSVYLSGESYRVHFPDGGDDCGGFLGMESAREYARECLGA